MIMSLSKQRVVLVGIYLPGVYPAGDEEVVSRLLATSFLKAVADSDPEISARYDIEILDIPTTMKPQKIAEQIWEKNPQIVGYSVYMWNYDQMAESLKILKKSHPEIRVILGGPLVTYTPEEMLQKNPGADIIICGNAGELRFRQLLKSDFTSTSFSQIPRISYRDEEGKINHTGGTVTEDVTQIPSIYETKTLDLNDGRRHTVFIETFRGCPFSCGYCIWGPEDSSIHKFDLDQLCRDIEIIYNHPRVETVIFTDACLFYTRERAKIICDKISSCSRKIPTVMTLDALVLNKEMVDSLRKINLYQNQFHFGLQTSNPAALEILKRPGGGKPEMYREKMRLLREFYPKAEVSFDLIYGLPGDDYAHFRETVDFTLSLKPSKIHFSPLLLLPGTRFFNERDKMGFVYDDEPPFMVRANQTFSFEDMQKAIRLVLWAMALLYFPAIRETLYKLGDWDSGLKRIDLIEEWVEILRRKVDPLTAVKYEFTIESNNEARRTVMNILSRPENCVHCYESMLELLRRYGAQHLAEDILFGINYYKEGLRGNPEEKQDSFFLDPTQLADQGIFNIKDKGKIESVKVAWISA